MSIRERVTEAAVMRSLGFTSSHILALFMGESLVLTVGGALVGVGGAKLLYGALAVTQIGTYVWADMRMRPETILFCMGLSIVLALLAASLPAYRAVRINIAEALRFTG
jgi:putative ABC transport system permease protein